METYKSNYIQKNYVEGKVIIITGASSGFGKLTAKRAARSFWRHAAKRS